MSVILIFKHYNDYSMWKKLVKVCTNNIILHFSERENIIYDIITNMNLKTERLKYINDISWYSM